MNWKHLRSCPWLDTRSHFVAHVPRGGTLLDMGSSDGSTLQHLTELRPDLTFLSTDIEGKPEAYPAGCEFFRGDITADHLPWPDASIDAITCMHLVEHLDSLDNLFAEASRVLKPGGRIYIETPHVKTLDMPHAWGKMAGKFTVNFFDDGTHIAPVEKDTLDAAARPLVPRQHGTSRNWIFVLSYGLLFFTPVSHKKLTAYIHFHGWSFYTIFEKHGVEV